MFKFVSFQLGLCVDGKHSSTIYICNTYLHVGRTAWRSCYNFLLGSDVRSSNKVFDETVLYYMRIFLRQLFHKSQMTNLFAVDECF